jgi:hypothetical protein
VKKNPLTPAYRKALAELAAKLPTTEPKGRARVSGADLLAKGVTRTSDGQPILSSATYKHGAATEGNVAVNHHKRLIRAFEQGGQPAVVKYLQPFEDELTDARN